MQRLLLIFGIPLLFVAGIAAYETGNLLWLGLVLPFVVLRHFARRELKTKDPFARLLREVPEQVDSRHIASRGDEH